MDFELTDTQRALQDAARTFAENELGPIARELEETHAPLPTELRQRMGELGFLGVNYPEAYGGLGLDKLEAVIVLEEFSRVSVAVAFPVFEALGGPAQTILHFAPDWLKRDVLPRVIAGDMMVAASLSEPDVGTALTDLSTRGEIKGDKILLNGAKRWCSGAGSSEGIVLYCRLADKPGADGIGAVYLERDTPGVAYGKPERFLFHLGVRNSEIYLDNAEVPVDNIIVPAGGFKKLMSSFNIERLANATQAVGVAQSALDYAVQYTQERTQFGRSLCDFQAVQLRLAEMKMDVEAARLLIHRAAARSAKGLPSAADSSLAKAYANEAARRVVAHGIQVMGACGVSKEFPMEQKFRDAWVWGIGGGHIDMHKVNIAADLVGKRFSQRAD